MIKDLLLSIGGLSYLKNAIIRRPQAMGKKKKLTEFNGEIRSP